MQNFERTLSDRLIAAEAEVERLKILNSFYRFLISLGCDDDSARKILTMQAGWVGQRFEAKGFTDIQKHTITLWAKHLPA